MEAAGETVLKELEEAGLIEIKRGVSLKTMTGFRTGGTARTLIFPLTPEACGETAAACRGSFAVLGFGSNVLARDGEIRVPIICTSRLNGCRALDENGIFAAQAGVGLTRFALNAAEAGFSGSEFLFGIPGSMGGASVMNAGAYGHQLDEIAVSFKVCSPEGRIFSVDAADADLAYRHSRFQDSGEIVLETTVRLTPADKKAVTELMNSYMHRRREKQPLEFPSCGSYFKRPEGFFAGRLIEDCSLKGFGIGGAQISEKHAGFIINRADATTADIEALEKEVRKRVMEKFGVELEREVRKLGADGFEK